MDLCDNRGNGDKKVSLQKVIEFYYKMYKKKFSQYFAYAMLSNVSNQWCNMQLAS